MDTLIQHQRRTRSLIATLIGFVLAFSLIPITGASAASSTELLPNPTFAKGTDGWVTNGSTQKLTIVSGVAQLTTTKRGNTTLNDRPNAVQNTAKGAKYSIVATVRTTTPSVNVALRIREVSGQSVTSSEAKLTLLDTKWHDVELNVTTAYSGSALDLNLVARDLAVGSNLQVKSVSIKETSTSSSDSGASAPVAPPAASNQCQGTVPTGQTLFGTSIYQEGRTFNAAVKDIDKTFGEVPVVRYYSPGLPHDWSSANLRELKGRTIVFSFKVSTKDINSGKHDTHFKNWFESDPNDQTIYWSLFHEPEDNISSGEFTAAEYRAAWERLSKMAKAACKPNMHSTLILMQWTMSPQSGRNYRDYDAGKNYVDVIAFDPYNSIKDLNATSYTAADTFLKNIVTTMKVDGRPWGIAEMGSRLMKGDSNGAGRAKWLTSVANEASKQNARFVIYFHSIGHNGDFRLLDANSRSAWDAVVK